LGGVHDEAEFAGHRRTVHRIAAGNIVQPCKAGRRNPVLMLDEVTNSAASLQASVFALLEVLDPEQNNTFATLSAVPFDLLKVLFIGTANCVGFHTAAAARPHGNHRTDRLYEKRSCKSPSRYLLAGS